MIIVLAFKCGDKREAAQETGKEFPRGWGRARISSALVAR